MSAQELREAAALMRERAEAEHIASWQPAVWLAVADLLDHVATLRENAPTILGKTAERVMGHDDQVDAIARAYLGGQP